jgi:hypothetical protein
MFKQATPTGFESNELTTAALLDGKVDAQVSDSTAAIYMARQNPRLSAMSPDKVLNPVYVAMLLRREDQTLLNYINIWIDQIESRRHAGENPRQVAGRCEINARGFERKRCHCPETEALISPAACLHLANRDPLADILPGIGRRLFIRN